LIAGLEPLCKKEDDRQEIIENLERVLKQADLVKFAKSKPLILKSLMIEINSKVILTLDNSIPVEVEQEDLLLNEAQERQSKFKFN
jgi:hypothetical protein